jgi:hypothetical protein
VRFLGPILPVVAHLRSASLFEEVAMKQALISEDANRGDAGLTQGCQNRAKVAGNGTGAAVGQKAQNPRSSLRVDARTDTPKKARSKTRKRARRQMLTRAELDGRTVAGKLFNQIVRDIESDLGGHAQLSAVEIQLIEAFAGAAVRLNDLNARALLGQQPLDLSEYSNAVGAMVRVAARIGVRRRAKDVTPSLSEYLAAAEAAKADDDDDDDADVDRAREHAA